LRWLSSFAPLPPPVAVLRTPASEEAEERADVALAAEEPAMPFERQAA
jgi:hypothetical protein